MVICLHKKGIGSKKIGTMLGIDDSLVRSWIRKYRADGMDALRPYTRKDRSSVGQPHYRRHENESLFQPALKAFATTLEPIASITRRYQIDYQSFRYHVERYHPDLVAQRNALRGMLVSLAGQEQA